MENVSVNRLGDIMNKNVIIVLDEHGFIEGVYCPDQTFTVDLLDRSDQNATPEEKRYYKALEEELENLEDCF